MRVSARSLLGVGLSRSGGIRVYTRRSQLRAANIVYINILGKRHKPTLQTHLATLPAIDVHVRPL